ncbi:hypothetical protein MuYL_3356 [Mucilaginibacter xinganensis]|uniref:Uncharacterized protein n=1 Tax=Mucilaginibacter xinganensis TaxID=1234841 RepID=A0A223P079_9SPHI|nr:hypothetical protein MuYL_3356 [Mucilaginibacter xinganensis]
MGSFFVHPGPIFIMVEQKWNKLFSDNEVNLLVRYSILNVLLNIPVIIILIRSGFG